MAKVRWFTVFAVMVLLSGALISQSPLACAGDDSDDWSMYHHDGAYTGATNDKGPKAYPKVLWMTEGFGGGATSASVAVADGIVYASSIDLFAFNASTGRVIWTVYHGGSWACSPTVESGIVYTTANNGTAYNATSGEVIWTMGSQGSDLGFTASSGYCYTCDKEGRLQARNATNGKLIWNSEHFGYYSPTISDGRLYFNGYLTLNAYDGTLVWNSPLQKVLNGVTAYEGYLYGGSDDGNLYCLNALNGQKVWNYSVKGWIRTLPAVANGYVYFGSLDRNVYALNASTGEKIWIFKTNADPNSSYGVNSSPAVADGVIYIGADDGKIYALDAYNGTELWTYQAQSSVDSLGAPQRYPVAPAVANGTLYITSTDHLVTALVEDQKTEGKNQDLLILFVAIAVTISAVALVVWLRYRGRRGYAEA